MNESFISVTRDLGLDGVISLLVLSLNWPVDESLYFVSSCDPVKFAILFYIKKPSLKPDENAPTSGGLSPSSPTNVSSSSKSYLPRLSSSVYRMNLYFLSSRRSIKELIYPI